jgi:hypothetical protein
MSIDRLSTKYHVNSKGELICSSLELADFTTEAALFVDVQILLEHYQCIPLVLMFYNVY